MHVPQQGVIAVEIRVFFCVQDTLKTLICALHTLFFDIVGRTHWVIHFVRYTLDPLNNSFAVLEVRE